MIYINVDLEGDTNFFEKLEDNLNNLLPLSTDISQYMLEQTRAAFNQSKSPLDGDPWDPLKRPRPDGKSTPILVDTGALKNSFSAQAKEDAAWIGSPIFYASFHNVGTSTMAKRQIIPIEKLPKKWETDIGTMAYYHLIKI